MNRNQTHKSSTLELDGRAVLCGLLPNTTVMPDPDGNGAFLKFDSEQPRSRHVFKVGRMHLARFTACYRYKMFWMTAAAGTSAGQVPVETQSLLAELDEQSYALIVPLLDGPFRASLQGAGEDGLELVVESGDPAVVTDSVVGLFVAVGANPYTLVAQSAPRVMQQMKTGRLRAEKALPAFVNQFGWCTWDAFYHDVSQEHVRMGLESFQRGGLEPNFIILDDGWQSTRKLPGGEERLTAFHANDKFPGDLAPTVAMAKTEFGIESFLVWHAITGYWSGVDGDALPGYDAQTIARSFSPAMLRYLPQANSDDWGATVGLVPIETVYRFFQDYYRHLRLQGVDGVKVDTQAVLEGLAYGMGGRVPLMQRYHEAVEGAAHTHFKGTLINCMSCSSDMLYSALNSTLTRTSTDFWPKRPETHGRHMYVNAQVGVWFGEFIHPDWDMFQSAHPMGSYHAAGRAVSGGPVYVSDTPAAHDFALLRKLVLPDGSILRAREPGRPTRDCLFHDPTREPVLLKVFNHNLDAGVIGVFNARYDPNVEQTAPVSGSVSPADVEGLEGEQFAVYAHYARELRVLRRAERWNLTLAQLTCEVFTIVPIRGGVAPIGLVDLFNSSGAVVSKRNAGEREYEIKMRGPGRCLIWSERQPTTVTVNGLLTDIDYDTSSHACILILPAEATVHLRF
ncbi:MAG: hypothetical protein HY782_09395 [Chloroflexi bacterium]|nr:hypothetical protein [Chloroflexota bacterium]